MSQQAFPSSPHVEIVLIFIWQLPPPCSTFLRAETALSNRNLRIVGNSGA
jgi:hypothetical protein